MTYLAAVCHTLTEPLVLREMTRAVLAEGQVRVQVHRAAINFADILMSAGKYQEKPPLPFVAGGEVSGIVIETGKGVSRVKAGDRIVAMLGGKGGGFAQECVVDHNQVFQIPPKLSFETAVAIPVAYGTAHVGLLHRADLKKGDTVLVTAAAGGVGLAAVDIAKNLIGANVIAAAGGAEKLAIAKQMGADHCIDYTTEDIREKVKEFTQGNGVDAVFECVGGEIFNQSLRSLAWEGRMVVIGFLSGDIPKVAVNTLLVKNISVMGLYWGAYGLRNPMVLANSIYQTMTAAEDGHLHPHVSRTFPLAEVNDAFTFISSRKSTGKVLLNCQTLKLASL